MLPDVEDADPLSYLGISEAYYQAFEAVWQARLAGKVLDDPGFGLIVYPLSQLLGISAELAMKGILLFRTEQPTRTHNLLGLLSRIEDAELLGEMDETLLDLPLPSVLIEANERTPTAELEAIYRSSRFQTEMLNLIYDRPFRSRYPQKAGVCLPDLPALHRIVRILHGRLAKAAEMASNSK